MRCVPGWLRESCAQGREERKVYTFLRVEEGPLIFKESNPSFDQRCIRSYRS